MPKRKRKTKKTIFAGRSFAASCYFHKHRYHQDIMPLLTGANYPTDIVNRQKYLLSLKGYHVVFDEACTRTNWERDLPCSVKNGLVVNVLAYQRAFTSTKSHRFRFCINHPRNDHYVEIGDYVEGGIQYVTSRVNRISLDVKRRDLVPDIGTYFWVQFIFVSGDKCKGNLSNKPLGFMFVTSKITVQGRGSTSSTDKTIQFSVHQHDREDSTKKTFTLNPGQQTVSTIEFQILSFGVTAIAGDGSTTGITDCDGSKEVILRIVKNFYVEKVIVRTGMYNFW